MNKNRISQKRAAPLKKVVLICAAAVVTVGVAAGAVLHFASWDKRTSPYPEVELNGHFAIVDDEAGDIFENGEYLELDRNLYVKEGGLEYSVSDGGEEENDAGVNFFLGYFDAVAKGECERYNSMFSDAYYEKFLPQEEFTQQMVYDMHIEKLSETDDGGRLTLVYYVDYKIHKNNGTFRRDILHDASRRLCFTLSGTADSLKIDLIEY